MRKTFRTWKRYVEINIRAFESQAKSSAKLAFAAKAAATALREELKSGVAAEKSAIRNQQL